MKLHITNCTFLKHRGDPFPPQAILLSPVPDCPASKKLGNQAAQSFLLAWRTPFDDVFIGNLASYSCSIIVKVALCTLQLPGHSECSLRLGELSLHGER